MRPSSSPRRDEAPIIKMEMLRKAAFQLYAVNIRASNISCGVKMAPIILFCAENSGDRTLHERPVQGGNTNGSVGPPC